MKAAIVAGALLLVVAAPASAMSVQAFLTKAEALKKKGPLALFSSDMKLLKNQILADAGELRTERLAAAAAGRATAFCPPEGGIKLSDKDIVAAMEAVPPAQRASTHTKAALRTYFSRRFPCRPGQTRSARPR